MIKTLIFSTLIATTFTAQAADWQREFFSSIHNELPASKGVAVDNLGFTHLQGFNRQIGLSNYYLAHTYTVDAQGQIPWTWGLSFQDKISECGVYAKSGQRLDCFQRTSLQSTDTFLAMRSSNNSQALWQTTLPMQQTLADAVITSPNQALIVTLQQQFGFTELYVKTISSGGIQNELSNSRPCFGNAVMTASHFRMPENPNERIRHLSICTDNGGSILNLRELNLALTSWSTLASTFISSDFRISHSAINQAGKGFVLVKNGIRSEVLSTHRGDFWQSQLMSDQDVVSQIVVSNTRLVALSGSLLTSKNDSPDTISSLNLQASFSPFVTRIVPELRQVEVRGLALTAQNDLLVANRLRYTREKLEMLSVISDDGSYAQHYLPFNRTETPLGKTFVFEAANNGVILARNIQREDGLIGIRANRVEIGGPVQSAPASN